MYYGSSKDQDLEDAAVQEMRGLGQIVWDPSGRLQAGAASITGQSGAQNVAVGYGGGTGIQRGIGNRPLPPAQYQQPIGPQMESAAQRAARLRAEANAARAQGQQQYVSQQAPAPKPLDLPPSWSTGGKVPTAQPTSIQNLLQRDAAGTSGTYFSPYQGPQVGAGSEGPQTYVPPSTAPQPQTPTRLPSVVQYVGGRAIPQVGAGSEGPVTYRPQEVLNQRPQIAAQPPALSAASRNCDQLFQERCRLQAVISALEAQKPSTVEATRQRNLNLTNVRYQYAEVTKSLWAANCPKSILSDTCAKGTPAPPPPLPVEETYTPPEAFARPINAPVEFGPRPAAKPDPTWMFDTTPKPDLETGHVPVIDVAEGAFDLPQDTSRVSKEDAPDGPPAWLKPFIIKGDDLAERMRRMEEKFERDVAESSKEVARQDSTSSPNILDIIAAGAVKRTLESEGIRVIPEYERRLNAASVKGVKSLAAEATAIGLEARGLKPTARERQQIEDVAQSSNITNIKQNLKELATGMGKEKVGAAINNALLVGKTFAVGTINEAKHVSDELMNAGKNIGTAILRTLVDVTKSEYYMKELPAPSKIGITSGHGHSLSDRNVSVEFTPKQEKAFQRAFDTQLDLIYKALTNPSAPEGTPVGNVTKLLKEKYGPTMQRLFIEVGPASDRTPGERYIAAYQLRKLYNQAVDETEAAFSQKPQRLDAQIQREQAQIRNRELEAIDARIRSVQEEMRRRPYEADELEAELDNLQSKRRAAASKVPAPAPSTGSGKVMQAAAANVARSFGSIAGAYDPAAKMDISPPPSTPGAWRESLLTLENTPRRELNWTTPINLTRNAEYASLESIPYEYAQPTKAEIELNALDGMRKLELLRDKLMTPGITQGQQKQILKEADQITTKIAKLAKRIKNDALAESIRQRDKILQEMVEARNRVYPKVTVK